MKKQFPMMNITKYISISLFIFVFILAACNGTTADETESVSPTSTSAPAKTDPGYPPPAAQLEPTKDIGYPPPVVIPTIPGYPEPNSEQPDELYATPGAIPQAASSSGVVVGMIQVNKEPIPNLTIYLAEVLIDGEGQERVASYDRVNSPRAFTNEEGQFVFSNIQPGNYGLVLDTVLSSYLLHQPQEDVALIITVEAGEATSIELLNYDDLPIPQTE